VEGALYWSCLPCHDPQAAATPQQASSRLLGSQEPLALSQRVPLLVMPLVVHRAGTLGAAAHSEVPADQRVDDGARACGAAGTSHLSFRKRRV
jgi:hypothetical protein